MQWLWMMFLVYEEEVNDLAAGDEYYNWVKRKVIHLVLIIMMRRRTSAAACYTLKRRTVLSYWSTWKSM
jgi:hypothetical protein